MKSLITSFFIISLSFNVFSQSEFSQGQFSNWWWYYYLLRNNEYGQNLDDFNTLNESLWKDYLLKSNYPNWLNKSTNFIGNFATGLKVTESFIRDYDNENSWFPSNTFDAVAKIPLGAIDAFGLKITTQKIYQSVNFHYSSYSLPKQNIAFNRLKINSFTHISRTTRTFAPITSLVGIYDTGIASLSWAGRNISEQKFSMPTPIEATKILDGINYAVSYSTGLVISGGNTHAANAVATGSSVFVEYTRRKTLPYFTDIPWLNSQKIAIQNTRIADWEKQYAIARVHGIEAKTLSEMYGKEELQRAELNPLKILEYDMRATSLNFHREIRAMHNSYVSKWEKDYTNIFSNASNLNQSSNSIPNDNNSIGKPAQRKISDPKPLTNQKSDYVDINRNPPPPNNSPKPPPPPPPSPSEKGVQMKMNVSKENAQKKESLNSLKNLIIGNEE